MAALSDEARERLVAIGEIAAEVAHELRNELQIISANVYLARQAGTASGSGDALAKIERHARIAHSIVDDLMALARGEPAQAAPMLVVEALAAARESAELADYVDHVPFDLKARAHHGLLTRLFHVLYDNAIGASAPRRPTIETSARIVEGKVWVDVRDDGPGVPAAVAKTLFDPLVTARPGGTGLGLALARRIAAAHGGTIALVESASGACFRVEIPA